MKQIRKEKRKIIKLVLLVIVLLLLFLCFRCSHMNMGGRSVKAYAENVNAITEIDYAKQQEALNTLVEEGKMNVNYSSQAIFNGTVSEKFNIKNIRNNHYPIEFELYDEDNRCIYASKMIQPGYEMNNIELDEKLSVGVHECKLEVRYAQEGNISSVFPITIEVR